MPFNKGIFGLVKAAKYPPIMRCWRAPGIDSGTSCSPYSWEKTKPVISIKEVSGMMKTSTPAPQ